MSLHLDTIELMALSSLKQCILGVPEDRDFPVTDGLTLLGKSQSIEQRGIAEKAVLKILERM